MRSIALAGLLAATLVGGAQPSHALSLGILDSLAEWQKPNLHAGPAPIHPYYKITELYDSNIFLQPKSKVVGQNANNNAAGPVLGSMITENNFGVRTELPVSELHKFDLWYDFVWRAFKKDPRVNNAINQTVEAGYTYKGPEGVTARVQDTYLNTNDPATTEQTQRNRRWQNTGSVDAEYAPQGGNLFVGVDAQHTIHKYITDDPLIRALLNRFQESAGLRGGWQLQPKTRVYAAYHRELVHYTVRQTAPTKNNRSHRFDVGVEGELAPKLTGRVETGIINRRYDEVAVGASSRVRNEWHVDTKLDYRPLERTSIVLGATRRFEEATFGTNQFYVASGATLNVTHKLPYKVTLGLTGALEYDKYQNATTLGGLTANRRDDLYQVGTLVGYDIQEWLRVSGSYLYRTRFSRFSEQFNYKDHQTGLTLALMF